MGRWSRQLAPRFVEFAGVQDGDVVLDVGSGTGALAGAVSLASPSGGVTGVDLAAAFVAFAEAHRPNEHVRFEVGDAQQLRFSDQSFDRTLSLLNLNFIPDRDKALREMIRVTRAGGTVAAAVWDYGTGMQMLRLFWDEATALYPAMDARDERHMPLCAAGQLAAFWRAHGLRDVRDDAITMETPFGSFDDYWLPFLEQQGPAGAFVATLTDVKRGELRHRLRGRLLGDGPDRPIALTARAWAVRGVVP